MGTYESASQGERVIALDTETTGRSHEAGDRIVEIGCVEIVGNLLTGRTYHSYVSPAGRIVEAGAREVHGLSDEFLADKPKFRSIHRPLFEFIGNAPLVIHNARFDMGFINKERLLLGLAPLVNEVRDTLHIARIRFPGLRATLDALCSRFGVDNSRRDKHGALLDAELLAEVYIHLTGLNRLNLGLDDGSLAAGSSGSAPRAPTISRIQRPGRPPLIPTGAELAAFEAFVASALKKPIWETYGLQSC